MRVVFALVLGAWAACQPALGVDLWTLARAKTNTHRFSTLFTAQDVRDHLSTAEGMKRAIEWCKATGVTKVYLESYRSRYQADQAALERARDRFVKEGFRVAGAISATQIGKIATGWNMVSCYTNQGTQTQLRSIVEFTARLFNEVIIDDHFFAHCTCDECDRARKEKLVRIRTNTYPVPTDSWEDYRQELMLQLSQSHVIGAARQVNPKARVVIKYPQWYDRYRERGYDVIRQSREFDKIWVGTETRDRDKPNGQLQYEAYFVMRWLSGIGGGKTGGGWFDSERTTEKTYVEQARQTVLAGARETVLFSYGALQQNFGPEDVAALRSSIPELLDVAAEVAKRKPVGLSAYRPPGSTAEDEAFVFDVVGMLGIPLVPVHEFPSQAAGVFIPIHGWSDLGLAKRLTAFVETGRPVLITDGLARRISGKVELAATNIHVLRVSGNPVSLLEMPQRHLDELRGRLLEPLGFTLKAPADVALYPFSDGSWALANFSDRGVTVELNGDLMMLGARAWVYDWK